MILPATVRYLGELSTTVELSNDIDLAFSGVRETAEEVSIPK